MACCQSFRNNPVDIQQTDVHLSYLPLAHSFERMVLNTIISVGASMGFYHGELGPGIKEDIETLRPTLFVSVPRLWNRMADAIKEKLQSQTGFKANLIQRALRSKMANCRNKGQFKSCLWDRLVFKKVQQGFGGRVRYLISGSAPLSKDTIDFLKICFSCPFSEGYGLTETLFTANTWPADKVAGIVGGVAYTQRLKLEDVPDMKYFVNPTHHGADYNLPRGEICYKGPSVFQGYFKQPEKTAEVFDKDGFFHTGDVGELQDNLALKIIDRKKNIFKLQQGEYIAPEKLEQGYLKSPYIQQIFIYGDSLHNHLVAVVIPDRLMVEKWPEALKYGSASSDKEYEELIKTEDFKKAIQGEIMKIKKDYNFNSLEVPKQLVCVSEELTVENDCLTPTLKLKRNETKQRFIAEIREMYGGTKLQGDD